MAFHWRDGWFFKRSLTDGNVIVRHYTLEEQRKSNGQTDGLGFPASPAAPDIVLYIPAAEWLSIIASVSAADETSEQYEAAKRFHW